MICRAICPPGSWPLEMRSETAAAYVDEPSVEAFLDKVCRGVYSVASSSWMDVLIQNFHLIPYIFSLKTV